MRKMRSWYPLLVVGILPLFARAQSVGLEDPLHGATVCSLLKTILDDVTIYIAPPVVVIIILYGAFEILFSAGDAEKVRKGKWTILYAVIGYGIILVAEGIIYITAELLGTTVTWCS